MNPDSPRRAGVRLRISTILSAALVLSIGSTVFAQGPLLPAKKSEFHEQPTKRVYDLKPATAKLPAALDRSASVPAFKNQQQQKQQAIFGPVPSWTWLGPAGVNGQTENRVDPVSGRVTAIAAHPSNANIAYVGTAQGGLYRTLDGGATWTQMMDSAASTPIGTPLAIGAIAIDPTNPDNVIVGTGEGNNSVDSFFGSGLYIITGAGTGAPVVNGPYNLRASDNADIFTGRAINAIVIDPANHNNVFVATSSAVGGLNFDTYSVLPPRGLYRTTNAFTGTPKFTFITIAAGETNSPVTSAVIDPTNANTLVVGLSSQTGTGKAGIYRSINALAGTPTFTVSSPLDDFTNVKLAANKVGNTVTVYAVTDEFGDTDSGQLYKSTDGGATFGSASPNADGFAGGQGWYDLAVAVDPTNANKVYIGGTVSSDGTPDGIFEYSTDGGATFHPSVTGLHADTHAIAVSPENPALIYHGNDGGVWKSADSGANWTSLNNSTFSATQFQGLSVHPVDPIFSIGGTQDNGTHFLMPNSTFTRADFGDGGYTLIDQNATDNNTVTMYHTYFNGTGAFMGTARVLQAGCAFDGEWSFHGAGLGTSNTPYCDGSFDTENGINVNDDVAFYAPQALGPGNPNTWYFGTDKLYRSINRADTATAVSQRLETSGYPITAIAVAPQDDAVRVVGLADGRVFATSRALTTLQQIAGVGATAGPINTPAFAVNRIAIDPNNRAVAYVCFNGFGATGGPIAHVWKTTNLDALNNSCGIITLTPASTGLPDVPVNAIAIDPVTLSGTASTDIYVGTDAGVYYSHNGGASWSVYGNGLPHSAVFGLEIQNKARLVRAATHGRGMYQAATVSTVAPTPTPTPAPSAGSVVYGELLTPSPCTPQLTGSQVTFTWSANGANAFMLLVGDSRVTEPGGSNLYTSGQTGSKQAIVKNLPTDGRNIYVRLWSRIGTNWYTPPQDYTFVAQALAVQAPIIAPAGGTYHKTVTVNMASGTPGAAVHYTTDGSTPTAASPTFSKTFALTNTGKTTLTKSVRAIATKTGVPSSQVVTTVYTILNK